MSDLVGNPEDRFSQNEAHFIVGSQLLNNPFTYFKRRKPDMVARSVACPLRKQRSQDRPSHLAHSFVKKKFPSSADARRISCQLVVK